MEMLTMTQNVLDQIKNTIGGMAPEHGGILGANEDGVITHFYFDATGRSTEASYEPDVTAINTILAARWIPQGIHLAGIVHSHAAGNAAPSCGDISYGMRILQALDAERFYLPIVTVDESGVHFASFAVENDALLGCVCRRTPWQCMP